MTTTDRELSPSPAATDGNAEPPAPGADGSLPATLDEPQVAGPGGRENTDVDLGRIAWVVTVLGCLIAVVVLVLEGYYGYAGVTFAVGVAAAINLT